jgi:ABC-type Fe3+ transport system substrate-binding protein
MLFFTRRRRYFVGLALAAFFFFASVIISVAQVDWKKEWEKTLQEAKKEGKIVVGIPARAELRKELEAVFKPQFGIDMELLTARGPQNASRIASEYKAGVKYFDVFIGGSGTYESLVDDGMVEPLTPNLILPEVKEEKYWWGGHIWEDNLKTKRFLYSFIADAGTGGFWYNTSAARPEELRSLDDFVNPKWKGKIGFLDPRTPGSGQSIWSFLWDVKGEGYLRKLVQQDLFVSRDQRQLADALAKGKLAIALGVSFYTLEGFLIANLPIKELPRLKEGAPSSNGSGVVGIVKGPPHPYAAKVFVNWLLGKQGQELYTKVMHQSTRRVDVDTKWLQDHGVLAAKDVLTVEEYHRVRNHLEDKYTRVRIPAAKLAEQILN